MVFRLAALVLLAIGTSSTLWAADDDKTAAALIACAPPTYEAALDCLDKYLPEDAQAALAKPDGAIEAHFGLGMWIRNNWGLWKQGPLYRAMTAYGFSHPDDMSGAILDGFAARERREPFDVTTKAAEYQEQTKKLWDQGVKEGRAGSIQCPKVEREPKTEEEVKAQVETCLDFIAKSLEDNQK